MISRLQEIFPSIDLKAPQKLFGKLKNLFPQNSQETDSKPLFVSKKNVMQKTNVPLKKGDRIVIKWSNNAVKKLPLSLKKHDKKKGIILTVPKPRNNWFKVKLDNGGVIKCRASYFKRDKSFDKDIIVAEKIKEKCPEEKIGKVKKLGSIKI